jgi:hypothetical protein
MPGGWINGGGHRTLAALAEQAAIASMIIYDLLPIIFSGRNKAVGRLVTKVGYLLHTGLQRPTSQTTSEAE